MQPQRLSTKPPQRVSDEYTDSPGGHMDADAVAARLEVQDLVGRCAQLGDRGRTREVARLYLPDGVLIAGDGTRAVGRPAIERYLAGVAAEAAMTGRLSFARHHVTSASV